MFGLIQSAWRYRFFILSSIRIELRSKFIRSRLGGLWMILHPLSQVLIFAFVLSAILANRLPGIENKHAYAIYLMAGTLAWSLFSEIVVRSVNLFVENANLLKKLAFPRIALPLIVTGSAVANNALLLLAIVVIFGILGHLPGVALLWLPLLLAVNIALALGLGLSLGVLNVFMRDIGQVIPVVMQFLFWFTPIVYMASIIPEQYRHWLGFNPLMPIITGYQDVLLYNRTPDLLGLGQIALFALVLLALSLMLFRRAAPEMADQL